MTVVTHVAEGATTRMVCSCHSGYLDAPEWPLTDKAELEASMNSMSLSEPRYLTGSGDRTNMVGLHIGI